MFQGICYLMFKKVHDFVNCLLFGSFAPKCDFSSVNNISRVNVKLND